VASRRRSLRLELVATLAVILMMAVVSLSLASEVVGARRHQRQAEAQLHDHARALGVLVAPMLAGTTRTIPRTAELEQALRGSIGTLGIVAIEIHRFVDGTPQSVLELGIVPTVPAPMRVIDPEGVSATTPDGFLVVDQPLRIFGTQNEPLTAQLRLVARPSPWTRLGDWRDVALLALGVGGVLLVLGVALLELQVLRPMARVRDAVDEVERGNLDTAAPVEGPRELLDLADAFNRMTASLRTRVRENVAQRDRLVRAEQLASIGRVAAGVAHEVGNPLAALLGYVELLLDPRSEPKLGEEQRQLLERSRSQLQRIQSIVGQLLEYARPPKQATHAIALGPTVTRLCSLLRHDPRCADVALEVEGEQDLEAMADPALLDQVLQNLVVNGCRAARGHAEHPRVVIHLRADTAEHATLEVRDNGPGVPDEVRPRLFEPFFTTAQPGQGTGLGLAISQALALQMEGSLEYAPPEATDSAPGAVFVLTLPRGRGVGAPRSNATDAADV
jgi:two-component system, NtrC family, sensor kinase